jgi:hypothetical protein
VTFISAALLSFYIVASPLNALNSTVTFEMYFLALVATSLRYDARISIMVGALAITQYGLLWAVAATSHDLRAPELIQRAGPYIPVDLFTRLILLGIATILEAREIAMETVGKKGRDFFRRRKATIGHELPGPTAETALKIAQEMAHIVTHSFEHGRTDAVYLVYNEFKSAGQQRVVVEPLLPVTGADLRAPEGSVTTTWVLVRLIWPWFSTS